MARSRGTAVSVMPRHTASATELRAAHLNVDVLDRDRRLIHQNADRQRQAAERHQVDRLAGEPERHECRDERERNVQHDNDHANASRAGTPAPSARPARPRPAPRMPAPFIELVT